MKEIELKLEIEDWQKAQKVICREVAPKKTIIDNIFVNTFIWIIFGAAAMFLYRARGYYMHWPSAIFAAIFLIIIWATSFLYPALRQKKLLTPTADSPYCQHSTYTFTSNGLKVSSEDSESFTSWGKVLKVIREEGMIYIFIDKALAYTLPETKLDSPDELYEYINKYI